MGKSHYQIKVSHDLVHLFTIYPESLATQDHVRRIVDLLEEKLPRLEGYTILLSYIKMVDMDVVRRADGSIRILGW